MKVLKFLAGPVLTGIVVGLAVLWLNQNGPNGQPGGHLASPPVVTSYADVVAKAAPAVVNIYTTQIVTRSNNELPAPLLEQYMQEPRRERILSSLGSGVIVSPDGYLLTSYHVIRDADEILVALLDGRESPARVVGTDPETDLALLHISLENLPVVSLSNDGPVRVGDVVLAIGNPLGVGQTVSMGIASATGRSNLGIATFENFIQTDAAINRGNSGGALIDTRGNLIGINTAILSTDGSWEGIGFATPATTARNVMNDLIEHGRVIRGWLGVTVKDVTPSMATDLGLREVRGGLIQEVALQGPAHKGGVRPGDVLVGIEGQLLRDGYEAMNIISAARPGTKMELTVIRNREETVVTVEIGTRPPANET
ncbi:serine endopeptidase [Alcanivorax sp. S71-1-4]|jgi:serine protease DegS|uniref:S1C family serine protease n=1 Tax=Alcanivorax sp. S71-1-4 TaxID=1177159 RepID=UPI0013581653|nr:trypsin-like peptidase domain-containing protein [Alcanivorax sp. S71-1-4]KAF0805170.1 serine endopeptidase [Alcanivorax sp. S71-1-4]